MCIVIGMCEKIRPKRLFFWKKFHGRPSLIRLNSRILPNANILNSGIFLRAGSEIQSKNRVDNDAIVAPSNLENIAVMGHMGGDAKVEGLSIFFFFFIYGLRTTRPIRFNIPTNRVNEHFWYPNDFVLWFWKKKMSVNISGEREKFAKKTWNGCHDPTIIVLATAS